MNTLQSNRTLTQSQKMMVFILSMSMFGVADIVTEIIPEIWIGPIDISIAYFAFIPLTLAILFDPVPAAVGAALGEIVFSDLLLGDFSGLGEMEGFLQLSIAMIIAGSVVKNPLNRNSLIFAALLGVGIDKLLGGIVDVTKIYIGVEEFEAVEGLPESVIGLEAIAFTTDMLITGVVFGVLPVLFFVPKLYGKIEPLLGIEPRTQLPTSGLKALFNAKTMAGLVVILLVSGAAAILGEMDFNEMLEWKPEFVEQFGDGFLYMVIAAGLVFSGILWFLFSRKGKGNDETM
ncbi:MAG: cell division protein FtsQ, partial [Bacilli bacterium]